MNLFIKLILFFQLLVQLPATCYIDLSEINLERIYVGKLENRWRFPSDHLPIGTTLVHNDNSINIISWNVLNSAYLHWIYNNDQGFANSLITEEDIRLNGNEISVREQHIIGLLLEMIAMKEYPKQVLCLQECSEIFIKELSLQLPNNMKIIRSSENAVKNQNIVIYNSDIFQFQEKNLHKNAFPSEPARPLMEVVLSKDSTPYRIFNAHLRCDSAQSQRFELAKFVQSRQISGEITIVLGDLNVDHQQMIQAFNTIYSELSMSNNYQPISPYKTTVSPELYSKAIDHIFVDVGGNNLEVFGNAANEVLHDLQLCVDLLQVEAKRSDMVEEETNNSL